MTEEREYILGTDAGELERLRAQHQVWVKEAYALWERAGIRSGDVVLDLGCGPGFTSLELAGIVGPSGTIVARDESRRFLEFLRAERDRLGLAHLEPSAGRVEDLDLPPEHFDAAYSRWLLSWVADAGAILEKVARGLKPGGVVALQEYLDWGAMKLVPRSEAFDRVVAACMESWRRGGATIDVGDLVPTLATRCGLRVEWFRPLARLGGIGSLEWRWLERFFRGYLPKLVERGILEPAGFDAYLEDWSRRTGEGRSYCYTPTMVDAILRKP